MTAVTKQLTSINPLFKGVYGESLYASDFVNHFYKPFSVQELKELAAKFFRARQMLNTVRGQNTVSKVLGAKCLDGDMQDNITN
jgi:hypothetical protein